MTKYYINVIVNIKLNRKIWFYKQQTSVCCWSAEFIEPTWLLRQSVKKLLIEEFDHGSDWTLAVGLTHASRAETKNSLLFWRRAADGWVMLGNLPSRGGQQLETTANTAYDLRVKGGLFLKALATRWAQVGLACWWGKSSPRRRSLAGLRGWSATLELRHGPDSYGRQQWGILHNGRKPDAAIPRVWRRP